MLLLLAGGCAFCGEVGEVSPARVPCIPEPRVNVLLRPVESLPLERGLFVYWVGEGQDPARVRHYAGLVHRALLKARAFETLEWYGKRDFNALQKARKSRAYLVILEGIEVFAPTRSAPGKVSLTLRIMAPERELSLWELVAETQLCPCYAVNYGVCLGPEENPYASARAIEEAFFQTSWVAGEVLKGAPWCEKCSPCVFRPE